MWDAPPWDGDEGRIATGHEALLVKAAASSLCSLLYSEEELPEDGSSFSTYPFQNMTVEQKWWYIASMTASMLRKDIPKFQVNIISESFLWELTEQLKADLTDDGLPDYAESLGKVLRSFIKSRLEDDLESIEDYSENDCIEVLRDSIWLQDHDCLDYEMANRTGKDPLHMILGTSPEYYSMRVCIPTPQQVEQSRKYLENMANEIYKLFCPNAPREESRN